MKIIVKAVKEREPYVNIIKQEIPEVIVVWDKKKDAMDTYLRALETAKDEATIQLEDDIELTTSFTKKATAIISEVKKKHGDIAIQFFSMRKADIEIGSRLENGSSYLMAQATYLPPGMAKDFLQWTNDIDLEKYGNGVDELFRDYLKSNKLKYWIAVPSLVQHRKIKSAIDPRRSSARQSKTFQK